MSIVITFLIIVAYFAPSILAWRKRDRMAITMFNLFLGWTLIGWVIALVWSAMKDKQNA